MRASRSEKSTSGKVSGHVFKLQVQQTRSDHNITIIWTAVESLKSKFMTLYSYVCHAGEICAHVQSYVSVYINKKKCIGNELKNCGIKF